MPATTQGFQVGAQPNVQFADPRLLAPAYGNFLPSVGQGLSLYDHLAQIGDSAITDPIKQQLLQIQLQDAQQRLGMGPIDQQLRQVQLQDAQSRLGMAPLDQQLRLAQISEAQQNAARPIQIPDSIGISGGVNLPEISSPAGIPFDQITFKDSYDPQIRTTTGREIGAGGIVTPYTKNETLETGAQAQAKAAEQKQKIALQEAQIDYQKSHADYLANGGRPDHVTQLITARDAASEAGDTKTADQLDAIINAIPKASTVKIQTPSSIHGIAVAKMAAELGMDPDVAIAQVKASAAGGSAFAKRYVILKAAQNGHRLSPEQKTFTPDELAAEIAARGGVVVPVAAAGGYPNADAVKAAVASGQLTRDQALKILSDQFGFTP